MLEANGLGNYNMKIPKLPLLFVHGRIWKIGTIIYEDKAEGVNNNMNVWRKLDNVTRSHRWVLKAFLEKK